MVLEVRAASDVMNGYGAPEGMCRSVLDSSLAPVLAHRVLDCPLAHRHVELGNEDARVIHLRPDLQSGSKWLASLAKRLSGIVTSLAYLAPGAPLEGSIPSYVPAQRWEIITFSNSFTP